MKKRKIFWGIFFILAAIFIIISKLGIMPDVGAFSVLATVFWLWVFVQGIRHVNFYEILFPIAFICIIYDKPLGIESLTPWTVLAAALLCSIGLSLLFHGKKGGHHHMNINLTGNESGDFGSSKEQCNDEHIYCENNLGSVIRYINSDNFCDAHLENNFGSMKIYLDNAIIQQEAAHLEIENNFGQTVLYIPKEWQVHTDFDRSFGNINEIGACTGESSSILYIHGESNFGQIEIHYI